MMPATPDVRRRTIHAGARAVLGGDRASRLRL